MMQFNALLDCFEERGFEKKNCMQQVQAMENCMGLLDPKAEKQRVKVLNYQLARLARKRV